MYRIQWLEDLDSEIVQELLEFLKQAYPGEGGISRVKRKRLIFRHIFVPIIETGLQDHEFFIPESPEFIAWTSRLQINPIALIPYLHRLFLNMDKYFSTTMAAKYAGCSPRTMRRLAASGAIPARKTKRGWEFQAQPINRYFQAHV